MRERSATYLQQLYRRRLVLRRYRAMQAATAAWRKRHAAELVLIVQRELDRQRRIKLKVQQLTTMQNMRLCQVRAIGRLVHTTNGVQSCAQDGLSRIEGVFIVARILCSFFPSLLAGLYCYSFSCTCPHFSFHLSDFTYTRRTLYRRC